MPRLPQVNREDVPEELLAAFDEVAGGPAGGGTGRKIREFMKA